MCEFGAKEPHDVAVVRERSAPVENARGAVVIGFPRPAET